MQDRFGRTITYMRISLTDRCNLSCRYCKPEHAECFCHDDILSYEEILRICRIAITLGITGFKITGGEPFVRKGSVSLIERLKTLPGTEQVTVTTNGTLLKEYLPRLLRTGIDGINISLDTLDRKRYQEITGQDMLTQVLETIEDAYEMGLPVKVNAVLSEDTDEEDILNLISLIRDKRIALRLIEQMPFVKTQGSGMSGHTVRETLIKNGYMLTQLLPGTVRGNGPAVYYSVSGMQGYLGFIEAIHGKFCSSCNRVRLTSIGELKPCLYDSRVIDLREGLRGGWSDEQLRKRMEQAIYLKPREHHFDAEPAIISMSKIGG